MTEKRYTLRLHPKDNGVKIFNNHDEDNWRVLNLHFNDYEDAKFVREKLAPVVDKLNELVDENEELKKEKEFLKEEIRLLKVDLDNIDLFEERKVKYSEFWAEKLKKILGDVE